MRLTELQPLIEKVRTLQAAMIAADRELDDARAVYLAAKQAHWTANNEMETAFRSVVDAKDDRS